MSASVTLCQVDEALKERLKKFRLRKEKNVAALIAVIDVEKQLVVLDEEFEDITLEELQEELPSHLPRYLIISYVLKHQDGRVSYPLAFIFISPSHSKPELQMMYAGSKLAVTKELNVTKVFELRDAEELTTEWLEGCLV